MSRAVNSDLKNGIKHSFNTLQYVKHRVNRIEDVKILPSEFGAEVDLRAGQTPGKVLIHHDPWKGGDDFDAWLNAYTNKMHNAPLILNTKEDSLEEELIEKCKKKNLSNYFFLDTTLPSLVKWSIHAGESRFACRVSSYEPVSTLVAFNGKVQWLWVDCFGGIPLKSQEFIAVSKDFKICLVSPELQGAGLDQLREFEDLAFLASAVCTKRPDIWMENFR